MYHTGRENLQRFQKSRDFGVWVKIRTSELNTLRFSWGIHFAKMFAIPFKIRPGEKFLFFPLLFDFPQELPYTRAALSTDPANRMLLAVRAQKGGEDYWRWLSSPTQNAVEWINHFVDSMEGVAQSTAPPKNTYHLA